LWPGKVRGHRQESHERTAMLIEFATVLACLLLGSRYGGMGLGLVSGVGLFLLLFVFGLAPGEPPVRVMLTILAVIGCAATLQAAGGLNVMMQFAERLLRKHPDHITLLAPLSTWTITFLCGSGHMVYTLFPIIADIALHKGIRPERPLAVAAIAGQMSICASPVSVALVSLVSILAAEQGVGQAYGMFDIILVTLPASLLGTLVAALWSLRRGLDLKDDPAFQARLADPAQREAMYAESATLLNTRYPPSAYRSVLLFFAAIAAVVLLGAFPPLRPAFTVDGARVLLDMNLVIQMMMLIAGACMLFFCTLAPADITNGSLFRAGMTGIFSVFGVAWMTDTFFAAHMGTLQASLAQGVQSQPWLYAVVLFLTTKLINSQAAAIVAIAPMGLALGIDPALIIAFFPAANGYFLIPTYPTDLACIGFDRSGTTRLGNYLLDHSFMVPGLIAVTAGSAFGWLLARLLLGA
jgi:anaerobic C4-dicarboxylate transporter DcuB